MKKTTEGARTASKGRPADSTRPGGQVAAARTALAAAGACLMPAAATASRLCARQEDWHRFGAHWDELSTDAYAAGQGSRRLRRYGRFFITPGAAQARLLPHAAFVQPGDSNPLYPGVDRNFAPLTGAFIADPVFRALLRLLAGVAAALEKPALWDAKVHPFRVIASADAPGLPTPEGRHRDGVTLVSSLLVGRRNAAGGESRVFAPDGRRLLAAVLAEPGALLLGDDRRTLHSVSPVRPVDPGRPACRDVLVVTLTPG